MLKKPAARVGPIEENVNLGDVLDTNDLPVANVVNSSNVTLTGIQLSSTTIDFTGGNVQTNTFPSADAIVNALKGGIGATAPPVNSPYGVNTGPTFQWPGNLGPIPPGSTFRRIFRNPGIGTITLAAAASSGVSITGTATLATLKWREYVVRIKSSAPAYGFQATTSTGATLVKSLTGVSLESIANIQVGMSVYGTGVGTGAVVTGVNLDTGVVYVSANSTANGTVAISVTPTVEFESLRAGDV